MIKYVIHPGTVHSKNDGDRHFITFQMLCRLYGIDQRECLDYSRDLVSRDEETIKKLKHLYPQSNGNYRLDRR